MIVVDTNILGYLHLPGAHTRAAESLLKRDRDWAAPILWRSEFRNLLAGYLRRGALSFEAMLAIQAEAEGLLAGSEFDVPSRSVLELVQESTCSAYDCEFVVLARQLGTQLVTMDQQLLRDFPRDTRPLVGRQ